MSYNHNEKSLATRLEPYSGTSSIVDKILRTATLPEIEAAFLELSAKTEFDELNRIYGWNVEIFLRFLIEERVRKEDDIEQAKEALALVFRLLSTPGVAPDEPTEKDPEQWKNIKYSAFIIGELAHVFWLDDERKNALYPTFLEGFVTALEQGDNSIKEYLTHHLERNPVTGRREFIARLSSHPTLSRRAQKALNDYKALHLPGSITESGIELLF